MEPTGARSIELPSITVVYDVYDRDSGPPGGVFRGALWADRTGLRRLWEISRNAAARGITSCPVPLPDLLRCVLEWLVNDETGRTIQSKIRHLMWSV